MNIPPGHLHERGVWLAHELDPQGRPILRAVTSDGRCIASRSLHPGTDPRLLRSELETILNAVDPPHRTLRLVD